MKWVFTCCSFLLGSYSLWAQSLQQKTFAAGTDTLLLSENTVIQSSTFVVIGTDTLANKRLQWLPNSKGLVVTEGLSSDALVYFHTLQFDLSTPLYLRPMASYGIPVLPGNMRPEVLSVPIERPFNGLTRSGSISRSLQFGNGQDAVLNSNFNLQLSGKISEKTRVKASISDNSLPVQADGFSQQLREFDQIFIEIEGDDFGKVRAGDIQLNSQVPVFLNFNKRVTGGLVETAFPLAEGRLALTASGALARGRFHRNTFFGQEGNQGPYRLSGARGEQFILIISGSERVYIDGRLLQRGADADYLIDYSTGEITFTVLRPISREHRINVEFQYTDQSYLRSVVFGSLTYTDEHWSLSSHFYSEQDNPNQPLQTSLSDQEKQLLAESGDGWQAVQISTIRPLSGVEGEIPYRLVDSLGVDSVLVYAPADSGQLFTASFREVGQGAGDYVLEQSLATGNVYRWLPPINGIRQGNYAPVRQLQAPNQLQVFSQRVGYSNERLGEIGIEWAVSKNDVNRLSSVDKENDVGQALRLAWNQKKNAQGYRIDYQYNGADFETVERIRQVEFARDWNLPNGRADLHLGEVGWEIKRDSLLWDAALSGVAFGNNFKGMKPALKWNWQSTKWESKGGASWLISQDSTGSSDFFREGLMMRRRFGGYRLGVKSQGEWNNASGERFRQRGSYAFFDNELFQEVGDSANTYYLRLGLFQRFDDSARTEGNLTRAAQALGVRLAALYQPKSQTSAGAYVQFRDLQIPSNENNAQRTLTSRLHYRQMFLKRSVQWSSFYESGISNEPLRTYSYIRVPDGTGLYTWVDYNNNEVQELNEFELAVLPGQGQYVRLYTPNRQFIQAGRTLVTQTIGFQPQALLRASQGTPFWSRWSVQWNYSLENINQYSTELNPLNPFFIPEADSLQLARRQSNRVSLFFNRNQLRFGGDYSFLHQENRALQAYGPESQNQQIHRLTLRIQIVEHLNLQPGVEVGEKRLETPGFLQRNYRIQLEEFKLRWSWQLQKRWNLSMESSWRRNRNRIAEEYLESFRQLFESQYSLSGKSNLNAGLDYRSNAFKGNAFSPVGYEMLQGLLPGDNFLWNIYWEKQLFDFLQLNLRYDGRSAPGTPAIHTASMQVKALF